MHLNEYMRLKNLSDSDVAAKIGVARETISRIRRRKSRPDWETIVQLRKLSRGAVTANDFEVLEIN
jgi:transcriptional regulator with XRE-family HTH domain